MNRMNATALGAIAIFLWSLLAFFSVGAGNVPPFQLSAICFVIGGIIGVFWALKTGHFLNTIKSIDLKTLALGVFGIFGYHFFYFTALDLAPPASAGLIAYLWPLLIVLFAGFLPNEQVKISHIFGAIIAFAGAALIIGGSASFSSSYVYGYLSAVLCALIWSSYSVLSRLTSAKPTEIVAIYCVLSAFLAIFAHILFEDTVWPQTNFEWVSVFALGLGPVGSAFYVWDIGMKKGNIQILAIASYSTPLVSTLWLIIFGIAEASWVLLVSAALISLGAAVAVLAER